MAIADVLRVFSDLKREGALRDFMLFGSVAAMVHTRPFYTRDVDVAVSVASDSEYYALFGRLAALGQIEGHAIVLNGTPVELFPADISPIIQDALKHAIRKRVEGITVKVAPPEHLLLEALRVNRPQDRARVLILDECVNEGKLLALFQRLDHDGTLWRRYEAITGPIN
ncbi:MAG: hypothetical protein NTZ05_14940 [Chloroflexi bacterium]|nr:hypothetical protein [Chloroflexota bacterium]